MQVEGRSLLNMFSDRFSVIFQRCITNTKCVIFLVLHVYTVFFLLFILKQAIEKKMKIM